ncbi:hypothetical protein ACRASX_03815 [Flavobacterium sp. TMP13]|uniref:hypothetical protein n=1 Tax=Flavobacterium sp. TMP13 TaxID=3425950 RepID=UPI003D777754
MARITIKGVKGTGTNLKKTTDPIESAKNHKITFKTNRPILLEDDLVDFFEVCLVDLTTVFLGIGFLTAIVISKVIWWY